MWHNGLSVSVGCYIACTTLFLEPPGSNAKALKAATAALSELGIPLAPEKVEASSTKLTFLGIELDTARMTVHLAAEKLHQMHVLLATWQDWKACMQR